MGSIIEKNQWLTISCYCTFKKPEISCDILGLNFHLKNMLQMIAVIMLIRHFGESGHIIIK
jgi:hypothetical protein